MNAKNQEEARRCLQTGDLRALQACLAASGTSRRELGILLAEAGEGAIAEPFLAEAALAVPGEAEHWSDLGASYWGRGRTEEAMECFRRALEADPLNEEVWENYEAARKDLPRLKILALADARSPHTQRFASYLAHQGHEVHLLCDSPVEVEGVVVHAPDPAPPVLQFPPWLRLCQELIRRLRPDVVHGHYASIYGLWGALSGFHPYVMTLWGSDINVDPHLGSQYGELIRFGLEQADTVIGQSDDLNAAARRLAPEMRAPLRRLTFGIDTATFAPGGDAAFLRAHHELGDGPVVLSPRQFKPAANIHRIVEAIPRVLEAFPNARFILKTMITSHDDYYRQLIASIASLGVEHAVRIVQDVPYETMPSLYALAAVTLSVRDADGASNTVMESLASGTPVIASDIASNRELIGAEAGIFVDPHAPGAIARAILEVLRDPARAGAKGEAGRRRMRERHDHAANMARMEGLYRVLEVPEIGHARGVLARLQREAVALAMADRMREAHATCDRATGSCQTPRDWARLLLTAELVGHPGWGGDPDRLQTVFNGILVPT